MSKSSPGPGLQYFIQYSVLFTVIVLCSCGKCCTRRIAWITYRFFPHGSTGVCSYVHVYSYSYYYSKMIENYPNISKSGLFVLRPTFIQLIICFTWRPPLFIHVTNASCHQVPCTNRMSRSVNKQNRLYFLWKAFLSVSCKSEVFHSFYLFYSNTGNTAIIFCFDEITDF